MDLEALALWVDELVRSPASERGSGRLYAVRCPADTGDDDRPPGGGHPPAGADSGAGGHSPGGGGVMLELLAEGEARSLPQKVRLPAGVRAIALASGVWAAPMDDHLLHRSPSQHPQRRRAHLTVLVACEGDRDAVDVSVLRYGDGTPTVLRGGIGLIHQRMVRCWSRRPEAPWASKRSDSVA